MQTGRAVVVVVGRAVVVVVELLKLNDITGPELLMPAGNLEKLMTAFRYGADACSIGMPDFSLRYRENQTKKIDLKKAVDYAHKFGKKIYVTVNTYPHNESIKKIIDH